MWPFQTAVGSRSRSPLMLSFVAAIDDLIVELEGFEEFAQDLTDDAVLYVLPPSPASDMLLELKIIELENAPNGWKLVEFRRYKKPTVTIFDAGAGAWGGGGGGFGGGGGGGFANGGFGNGGFGGGFGIGGGGWGGGDDQWGGGDDGANADEWA